MRISKPSSSFPLSVCKTSVLVKAYARKCTMISLFCHLPLLGLMLFLWNVLLYIQLHLLQNSSTLAQVKFSNFNAIILKCNFIDIFLIQPSISLLKDSSLAFDYRYLLTFQITCKRVLQSKKHIDVWRIVVIQ